MTPSEPRAAAPTRSSEHAALHYPLFDLLRILLAVGVFFRHGLGDGYLSEHFGNACVQVFFALSGFLIGTILLHAKPEELPGFYFKRVVRIWIPYGIAVALLMTGTLVFQELDDPLLWQTAFYNVTFVTNVFTLPESLWHRAPMWGSAPHFWSICVEEQFYLVAPLLMVFMPRLRVPLLVGLVGLNVFVPHNFAAVSLGVLLSIWSNGRPIARWARYGFALVSVATVVFTFKGWVGYSTAAPIGAVALVGALAWPGRASAFGAFLGGMSYPFYLNHWIPLMMRPRINRVLGADGASAVLVAFVAALALAAVHFVLVDRPVLRARGRWYTEARGRRAWAVGVALVVVGLLAGGYFRFQNAESGALVSAPPIHGRTFPDRTFP